MTSLRSVVIITFTMADLMVAQMYAVMPDLDLAVSPRYFLGSPPLMNRQSGDCGTGQHHCQDINQPSICCPDDQFCYVNPQGQGACCAIDSNCDNPCLVSQYMCGATSNATETASASSSCCQRPCSAYVAYQCASSYGGACCSLGYSCTTNGCVSTVVAPTTLVSVAPSGCTTDQFSCPASVGGGCCDNGATCTASGTSLLCASGTALPSAIRTGPNGTLVSGIAQTTPSSGLSTGAKAGIGAGIAVLGCIVIAGLLWFCMRHRSAARQAQPGSQQSDVVSAGRVQSVAQTPRTGGRNQGMADYFGPAALAGPYTENESPGSVPYRGVPLSPNSPGDIVAAVEIGHSRDHSSVTSPGELSEQNVEYLKSVPETPEHRAELP